MNPLPTPDDRLREAFQARLAATPPPSASMLTRTMAGVARATQPAAPRRLAPRSWSALAAPARFATAAAIVLFGGTIAFGTFKVTHAGVVPTEGAVASRISLDRRSPLRGRRARTGTLAVTVGDIAIAVRRIDMLLERERGNVIHRADEKTVHAARTTRLVVQVREERLDVTMRAIAALGVADVRSIVTSDLSGRIAATTAQLQRVRDAASALPFRTAAGDSQRAVFEAEIRRLTAARTALERRMTYATIAIVLRTGSRIS